MDVKELNSTGKEVMVKNGDFLHYDKARSFTDKAKSHLARRCHLRGHGEVS